MPRSIVVVFLFILFQAIGITQNIIFWSGGFQVEWDAASCSINTTFCQPPTIKAYAYHPNGNIIWMRATPLPGNFSRVAYYVRDFINCDTSLMYSFVKYNYSQNGAPLKIDHLGRMYANNTKDSSIVVSNFIGDSLHYLFNWQIRPSNILFENNEILLLNFTGNYSRYDKNYQFIQNVQFSVPIVNLTKIVLDCDSSYHLAVALDMPMDVYLDSVNNYPSQFTYSTEYTRIIAYDLKSNKEIKEFCKVRLPFYSNYFVGILNPIEFLDSENECDLLLDLDRNNSSGLFPYDFKIPFALCAPSDSVPICDDDLYLHTSFPLDSISILISGALNFPLEIISSSGLPPGFSLIRRSDSTWTLLSPAASDSEYSLAIKSLRYFNPAPDRRSGTRHIIFQGHNSVKSGSLARSVLDIGRIPSSGPDTSLRICLSDPVDLLSPNTNMDSGGVFFPPLSSGNYTFVPGSDSFGVYQYITSDLFCGADTATITLSKGTFIPVDLGPDLDFCKGDSISFLLDHPALDSLWINGIPADPLLKLVNPGSYFLTLKSKDGCFSYDTLLIRKSDNLLTREDSVLLCHNSSFRYRNKTYFPGQIILDTLPASLSCDTLLRIHLIPSDLNLTKVTRPLCLNENFIYKNKSFPPGTLIRDTLHASSGCDTLLELWLQPLPLPSVRILGDTLICEGGSALLRTSASGSLLWSTGDTTSSILAGPGLYTLTVTDRNLCSDKAVFEVRQAPPLILSVDPFHPLCIDDFGQIILHSDSAAFPPVRFFLNGQSEPSGIFNQLSPGSYVVAITDALGCSRSDTVVILPPPEFEVEVTDQITIDAGASVLVHYAIQKGSLTDIHIDPSEGISVENGSLRIQATSDRVYTITFLNSLGCPIVRKIAVSVIQNKEFFAPLIFSPNNDGINDFWLPSWGSSWIQAEIKIYDRWGALMASPPPTQGWDGNHHGMPCIPGVYLYHIVLYDAQGTSTSFSGDLTLVR
jgi:gliding motility-associated-like protein